MAEAKHPYGGMPFHGTVVIKDGKKMDLYEAFPGSPRTIEDALRRVGGLEDQATKAPAKGR